MTDMKLKDLEGWKYVGSLQSSLNIARGGRGYGVFLSPDETKIAQVDMNDDDVTMIWDRANKEFEYVHPITKAGMDIVGVTPEQVAKSSDMEHVLRSAKKG